MIVEDDPMVASVNETYLSRLPGFCVIAKAADGLQALEKIKALSGSVDLVLLDVFMPKMDGLSFLEHLKNLAPSVSVIMITASQNKESLRTALAHGVADYIIKPFTFERFKAALLTFAERWRLLHEAEDFDQSDLDNIFHRGAPPQQFSKGIDAARRFPPPWKKSSLRSMLHQRPFPLRKLQTTWDSLEFPYANIFLISKKTTVFRVNFHTAGKDGP